MAKAPHYHLDDPRMPVREAAGTILHALCDQAAAEAPGVLGGNDVEAVHDMRVALRRLRSALDTFADWYEGGDFRTFERAARRLRKRLGTVRDADVLLERLRPVLAAAGPDEAAGIAYVVAELERRRADGLVRIAPAFAKFDRARTAV